MAEINYRSLLETNNYLRGLSDTTYWLCITRTVQESKLFPMNPYMLLSYLNTFYRLPTLLREIDAATPAEELGDRAREVSLKVDTVNAAWGMPAFYLIGREMLMNWGLLGPADAAQDVVDVLDFSRRFNLAYHRNDGHITNKEFAREQAAQKGSRNCPVAPPVQNSRLSSSNGGMIRAAATLIGVRPARGLSRQPSRASGRARAASSLRRSRAGARKWRASPAASSSRCSRAPLTRTAWCCSNSGPTTPRWPPTPR